MCPSSEGNNAFRVRVSVCLSVRLLWFVRLFSEDQRAFALMFASSGYCHGAVVSVTLLVFVLSIAHASATSNENPASMIKKKT